MKIAMLLSSLLLLSNVSNAALESLDTKQMQLVNGQAAPIRGAATINWQLSLNQTSPGVFDTATCSQLKIEYCRFAVAFNNRLDKDNKKQWLVFKGVQGSIKMQGIELAGTDLAYTDDNNMSQIKAALQLAFDESKPIQIRNLGFSALSIETDTVANEGNGNTPGYLATGKYSNTTNQFDLGRETGFTGMLMNGNLAVQGTLKVFSCDASMKRC